jgi:hypothetical protein
MQPAETEVAVGPAAAEDKLDPFSRWKRRRWSIVMKRERRCINITTTEVMEEVFYTVWHGLSIKYNSYVIKRRGIWERTILDELEA